jgi:phosphatidylglycerophosphate synthase
VIPARIIGGNLQMNERKGMNFPGLPWDSETIKKYRTQCQKPRQNEEFLPWFVLRRFSIYITLGLMRTSITPNGVSWIGLVFFLLTAVLMSLGEWWSFVTAALTYLIGYMADCVDGELAKLKGATSKLGVFIDTLIRGTSIPIFFGMAGAVFVIEGALSGPTVLILCMAVMMATFSLLVPLSYNISMMEDIQEDPVGQMRTASTVNDWIAFWTGMPGFFTFLPLIVLVDHLLDVGQTVLFVYLLVFLVTVALKTVVRTYLTVKAFGRQR